MICVSLAGPKLEDVRAAMARLDFVELRLDLIQASEAQVEALESMPAPDPLDIFRYMYADLPASLREQMEELREEVSS